MIPAETEQKLIDGLREAVDTLYNCRYSEQPLAKKLDALLKEITGKSKADLLRDWYQEAYPPADKTQERT